MGRPPQVRDHFTNLTAEDDAAISKSLHSFAAESRGTLHEVPLQRLPGGEGVPRDHLDRAGRFIHAEHVGVHRAGGKNVLGVAFGEPPEVLDGSLGVRQRRGDDIGG